MLEATKKVIQDQAAREVAPLLMVRAKCTVGMLSLLKALSSFFGKRKFSDGRPIDETLDALEDGTRMQSRRGIRLNSDTASSDSIRSCITVWQGRCCISLERLHYQCVKRMESCGMFYTHR